MTASRMGGMGGKGVTPFMKKKENVEDRQRMLELTVTYFFNKCLLEING